MATAAALLGGCTGPVRPKASPPAPVRTAAALPTPTPTPTAAIAPPPPPPVVTTAPPVVTTAPTASCPESVKAFTCHAQALDLHLGVDRDPDLAAAAHLYALACGRRYVPSCNNLAVLAAAHPELVPGVDARSTWERACQQLELPACDNARRAPRHPELAVELSLIDDLAVDGDRARQLAALACRAGDLFRCQDDGARGRVAAILAEECRGGEREQCLDAADAATDAGESAALAELACRAGQGKACVALATREVAGGATAESVRSRWQAACRDDGFDATADEVAARDDACRRWAQHATQADLARVARVEAARCGDDDVDACTVAKTAFEQAGAARQAFAIVKRQCEGSDQRDEAACDELADRYVLGDGTPRALPRRVALRGYACGAPTSWQVCKDVAAFAIAKGEDGEADDTYHAFCDGGVDEACDLGARAAESATTWGLGHWESIEAIARTYASLCERHDRDACRRKAGVCALAMSVLVRPRRHEGGMGDGTIRLPEAYTYLIASCPRATWTPAAQRAATALESYVQRFTSSGGHVEP